MRFFWYLCASILLLSLPTFSYLIPRSSFWAPSSTPAKLRAPARWTPGFVTSKTLGRGGSVSPAPDSEAVRAETDAAASEVAKDSREKRVDPAAEAVAVTNPRLLSDRPQSGTGETPPPGSGGRDRARDFPQLQQAMDELQLGYEMAYSAIFQATGRASGRRQGNPFEEALNQDKVPTADESRKVDSPKEPAEGGGDSPDAGGNSNPPAEPSDPSEPGGGEDTPPPPGVAELGPFDFLITGDFSRDGSKQLVWRARRDGSSQFVMEDSQRMSFFFVQSILSFGENDRLMTTDLNRDGLVDFAYSRITRIGTWVESYVRLPSGRFEPYANVFLYLQAVKSFAFFDFNQDGVDELALVIEDEPHLFVYEKEGKDWFYRREMVLPIRPGIVVCSETGAGSQTTFLYVIADNLGQVVSISSRTPTAFQFGNRTILNYISPLEVDLNDSGGETRILLFGLPEQVILMEQRAGRLRPFVSILHLELKMPVMVIGDYARNGTRQILWLP